jgi:hypothetical protein
MARHRRRVIAKVKLELETGKATPAPSVGRYLGPDSVNLALCIDEVRTLPGKGVRYIRSTMSIIHEERPSDSPYVGGGTLAACGVGSGGPGASWGTSKGRRT